MHIGLTRPTDCENVLNHYSLIDSERNEQTIGFITMSLSFFNFFFCVHNLYQKNIASMYTSQVFFRKKISSRRYNMVKVTVWVSQQFPE